LLAASYEEVLNTSRDFVTAVLGAAALESVFGGNALRFYQLDAH
jgi:predicted TIM-barrel fold metal-dependent hydrolase